MYRTIRSYYPFVLTLLVFGLVTTEISIASGKRHKTISYSNERELKVTVDAGFGDVTIAKASNSNIVEATIDTENSVNLDNCVDYEIRDKVGFLNFSNNPDEDSKKNVKKTKFHLDMESTDSWLNITDAVPVSFDLQLGVGKALLDMTGLSVKDLNLSTGASSVIMRFDEPNKSTIEDMSIEAGLSKFHGTNLCNANFNNFKFEGGLGTYTLDFGGKLDHDVDVNIEIGLGSITIIVPKNIGVKVYCEKTWISHLSIDDDFREKEDDTYYTPNYKSASGTMNMHVEAGMGSVRIQRD